MILISEIFGPTVQGEGALIGVPTVFVRTGGCDFRCSWCDTLYAVEPQFKSQWQAMTAGQIMQRVSELSGGVPLLVTLSGGESGFAAAGTFAGAWPCAGVSLCARNPGQPCARVVCRAGLSDA